MKTIRVLFALVVCVLTVPAFGSIATVGAQPGQGVVSPVGTDPFYSFSFAGNYSGKSWTVVGNLGASNDGVVMGGSAVVTEGANVWDTTLVTATTVYPGYTTSVNGAFNYDDQLSPNSFPILNDNGLLFQSNTNSSLDFNIFYDPGDSYGEGYTLWNGTSQSDYAELATSGSFTVSQIVPEPTTLLVWGGLGLAGAAALRRRKQPKGRWSEENRQAIFQVIVCRR